MSPKAKKTKEIPARQQELPIKYKGIPSVQRFKKRFGKVTFILDKISYWRSFIVWSDILINGLSTFFIANITITNIYKMPAVIPLLYIFNKPDNIFLPTEYVFPILAIHLLLQIFILVFCSKIYVRSRVVAFSTLSIVLFAAIIFYLGLYKSIRMNY